MSLKTADLCDAHAASIRVLEPLFSNFGGVAEFHGAAVTLKVFEDNSLVRATLEEPGRARVLVVDGGSSLRCALIGDQLAELAVRNQWAGILVQGCVRDAVALAHCPVGIQAMGTHPMKSVKRGEGQRDVPVHIAGVLISPGEFVYADEDGIIVSAHELA